MKLNFLQTENFRNLCENPPEFSDGLNVLYGSNAAGKTNTLEAIYLFAAGKSFRTKSERDFIKHGEDFARVGICFDEANVKGRNMSVSFMNSGQGAKKAMFVEGNAVDRASEFLGNFRAVLFTPDHLELVKGAPEERRRLVDIALCQIRPGFVRALNQYSKILAQRNNYLKNAKIRGQKVDFDYLDVLNCQLASAGGVIIKQRGLYCESLCRYACDAYEKIAGGNEGLFVKYVSRVQAEDLSDEKACCDALYEMYKKSSRRDAELGRTSNGPHRDELVIYISKNEGNRDITEAICKACDDDDGNDADDNVFSSAASYAARTFGSQGQQRSAVLAIKMAEGEIVKEKCAEYPVFLLDDLFSELDNERRYRLCRMLEARQCIITACDKASIPEIEGRRIILVDGGKYNI